MKYYRIYKHIIARCMDDDVATFEIHQDGEWQSGFDLGWQLLYGDLLDYQEITKNEAEKLINQA